MDAESLFAAMDGVGGIYSILRDDRSACTERADRRDRRGIGISTDWIVPWTFGCAPRAHQDVRSCALWLACSLSTIRRAQAMRVRL
jgi:hypothetical protein